MAIFSATDLVCVITYILVGTEKQDERKRMYRSVTYQEHKHVLLEVVY